MLSHKNQSTPMVHRSFRTGTPKLCHCCFQTTQTCGPLGINSVQRCDPASDVYTAHGRNRCNAPKRLNAAHGNHPQGIYCERPKNCIALLHPSTVETSDISPCQQPLDARPRITRDRLLTPGPIVVYLVPTAQPAHKSGKEPYSVPTPHSEARTPPCGLQTSTSCRSLLLHHLADIPILLGRLKHYSAWSGRRSGCSY